MPYNRNNNNNRNNNDPATPSDLQLALQRQREYEFNFRLVNSGNTRVLAIEKKPSKYNGPRQSTRTDPRQKTYESGFQLQKTTYTQTMPLHTQYDINNNTYETPLTMSIASQPISKPGEEFLLASSVRLKKIFDGCKKNLISISQEELLSLFEEIKLFPMRDIEEAENVDNIILSPLLDKVQKLVISFFRSPHKEDQIISKKISKYLNVFLKTCRSSKVLSKSSQNLVETLQAQINLALAFETVDIKHTRNIYIALEHKKLDEEVFPVEQKLSRFDENEFAERAPLISEYIRRMLRYLYQGYPMAKYESKFCDILEKYNSNFYWIINDQWDSLDKNLCGEMCLEKFLCDTDASGISWLHKIIELNDRTLLRELLEYSEAMSLDLTELTHYESNKTLLQCMIDKGMLALLPLLLKSFDVYRKDDTGQNSFDEILLYTQYTSSLAPLATLIASGIIKPYDDKILKLAPLVKNFYRRLESLSYMMKEELLQFFNVQNNNIPLGSIKAKSEESYHGDSRHIFLAHAVPSIDRNVLHPENQSSKIIASEQRPNPPGPLLNF